VEVSLKMTEEGFIARYIMPTVKEMVQKILHGEQLTVTEALICEHCGIMVDVKANYVKEV
jgi:hypothetical protein